MLLLFSYSFYFSAAPPAEAWTISPDASGISQGALPDRSPALQDKVMETTRSSGAQWIRLDLWWFHVEPAAPQGGVHSYNWDKFTALYDKAKAHNLKILLVVSGAPTWATDCTDTVWCPPNQTHQSDWKDFLTAAANKYKGAPYNVTAYEVWNEPNIQSFYKKPNPQEYVAKVLKPAYEAITTAQPSATIVTGGTSPARSDDPDYPDNISPWEFIRDFYAAGAKNYFHHVAHHPYTFPAEPVSSNPADVTWNSFMQMDQDGYGVTSIRTSMESNNDSAKSIWATEVGYHTGVCTDGCVSESEQANMLARVYNEWSKKNYGGKIFWYNMVDDSSDGRNFGLLRADYTAKPAYDWFYKIVSVKYARKVLDTAGLQHYWKLEEMPGNNTASNINNSAVNGIYVGNVVRPTNGVVVGTPAPTFTEESGNRVEVRNIDSAIRLAGSTWTIEFNARRVGGTYTWPGLMGRGDSKSANGWLIYNHHGMGDRLAFGRNGRECMTSSTAFSNGKAHHYVLTYANGNLQWYVDGSKAGSCSITFPAPSETSEYLWIGASPESAGNNALGHLSIYSSTLSEAQVKTHADARVTLP